MDADAYPTVRPPDHMDRWTRARRLYEHLVSLGLRVDSTEQRGGIEYLRVGVAPPRQLQDQG
jgi:hypothetical protein